MISFNTFSCFLLTFTDNTGHGGGVTSLDCHAENVLALSGSVDGTAKLLNTNNGKVKDHIIIFL